MMEGTTDRTGRARLIERFRAARRDPALTVLEGFHPLKHALRFGAEVELAVSRDVDHVTDLCRTLAPDVERWVREHVVPVDGELFAQLAPVAPATGVIAIARRRLVLAQDILTPPRTAPVVLLENPSLLDNVGAAIRVAAAAGAAGVVTTGSQDPWHPAAIRGSAGLHYALPVARIETVPSCRPLVALHPDGEILAPGTIPSDAVLAFGSERRGLSPELLSRADTRIAIPMEPGVSSLNLATAVAVVLYTWRLYRMSPPSIS